jgi:uncharacterized protein with FMN-binding domain
MKRNLWKVCCTVVLVGLVFLSGCQNLADIQALEIKDIAFSTVRDGTYEGLQDNWMVTAKVRATMVGGAMTDLQLLEHKHGPNHGADAIVAEVLRKQSLMVDAVSGSSYSSKVVRKAIELALEKGL